jgi:multiple sugar transport system permease protein
MGVLFIAPAMILFIITVAVPLLQALYMSFFDWNLMSRRHDFTWFENYVKMFGDPKFITSLGVTLKWTLVIVPITTILSIALAVILNLPWLRLKGFFRAVYFIPVVTNMVAASFVWKWLFEPTNGIVNYYLGLLGLGQPGWLADPKYALWAMLVVGVWKQVGFAMVIYLAGLQTVPRELYESAHIDGSGPVRSFFSITIPLLNPTIVFTTIMLVINAFRVFTIPYVMSAGGFSYGTPGGPLDSTRVFVLHIYDIGFKRLDLGYASANAFFLLLVILFVTYVQKKFLEKPVEY